MINTIKYLGLDNEILFGLTVAFANEMNRPKTFKNYKALLNALYKSERTDKRRNLFFKDFEEWLLDIDDLTINFKPNIAEFYMLRKFIVLKRSDFISDGKENTNENNVRFYKNFLEHESSAFLWKFHQHCINTLYTEETHRIREFNLNLYKLFKYGDYTSYTGLKYLLLKNNYNVTFSKYIRELSYSKSPRKNTMKIIEDTMTLGYSVEIPKNKKDKLKLLRRVLGLSAIRYLFGVQYFGEHMENAIERNTSMFKNDNFDIYLLERCRFIESDGHLKEPLDFTLKHLEYGFKNPFIQLERSGL